MSTTNQKINSNPNCNFAKVALLLGDVWSLLIISKLLEIKKVRFGDFLGAVKGISNSVLSSRLKSLVDSQIIQRESMSTMPPQVFYYLTPKGQKLEPIFKEIQKFGKE